MFVEEICDDLIGYECGVVIEFGVVVVSIGVFIGCFFKDKYIVEDEVSKEYMWWDSEVVCNDNKFISLEVWVDFKVLVGE